MFDERQATKAINAALNREYGITYPGDEILHVIDLIWDYYERNQLLDIDVDDDKELDRDDLAKAVKKILARDKITPIDMAHVDTIIDAELEYESTCEDTDDLI